MLGPLRLRTALGLVSPASWVSRRVLAALTLSEGNETTAERLGAAIWGRTRPRSRSALQVAVHRCRGLLAEHGVSGLTIETTTTGYRLALGTDTTDVAVFAELIARLPVDLSGLHTALGLWRGQVLADEVELAARFNTRINSLQRQRRDAAVVLGRGVLAAGRPARALAALESLARADPLDEELGALHIQALAAAGRQSDAVLAYRRITASLSEELGLFPGPQLRAAYERHVIQAAAGRRTGAERSHRPGSGSDRDTALRQLTELLPAAADAYITLGESGRAASTLRAALTAAGELGEAGTTARIRRQLSDLTNGGDG